MGENDTLIYIADEGKHKGEKNMKPNTAAL